MENKKIQTTESGKIPPIRYAFIDVPNTEGTVRRLGFRTDWVKLFKYLKEQWNCEKMFFYSGVERGDSVKIREYAELEALGYILRIKPYSIYRNRDKIVKITCPKCFNEIEKKINSGVQWKSNCDVELAVDATNNANCGVEYLIFSGDRDFDFLIRDVIEKGIKVYIVANARKTEVADRYFVSRFSTKLRNLIAEKKDSVFYVDIDLWKLKIKKDI